MLLASYEHIRQLGITQVTNRRYDRLALIRARLSIKGQDPAGRHLSDYGWIVLSARKTPAGWKIHSFTLARLKRRVAPLPEELDAEEEEAPLAASIEPSTTSPVTISDTRPSLRPSPPQHFSTWMDQVLSLTVVHRGIERSVRSYARAPALILLLYRSPNPEGPLCETITQVLREQHGLDALAISLGQGDSKQAKPSGACALEHAQASDRTQKRIRDTKALLPLILLVTSAGKTVKVYSGIVTSAQLLADITAHFSR